MIQAKVVADSITQDGHRITTMIVTMPRFISGIYSITNIVTGENYIGSAVNVSKRFKEHISSLNRGVHHSKHLQRSWRKHGIEQFEFKIVEEVSDISLLIEREQFHIDTINPKYNTSKIAGSPLGVKRSKETIEKNRAIQKSPEVNKKKIESRKQNNVEWHSKEARQKMREKKIGIPKSDEWKKNHSEKLKGKKRPESEIQRMKTFMTDPKNKIPCEYCGYMLNKNNHKQHTEKCKSKPK